MYIYHNYYCMFTGNDKKDEIQCKVEDIAGLNHVAKSSLSFSKTENDNSVLFHYSGSSSPFFPWPSITIIVSVDLTLSILLTCQVIVSLSLSIVSPLTLRTMS